MEDTQIDENAKIVWDYMLMHQELRKMDAIFALGSNDVRTAEKAADLYKEGLAPYIICSRGFGKMTKFDKPEAEVFKQVILARGVPEAVVITEPLATNTGENILFTKKLLKELGHNFTSFILVQKPYMERRTFATFKKQWTEPECIVTSPLVSYEEDSKDKIFRDKFIAVMVGDLIRIKEYSKLGFQIEQEIPADVWEAGQKLLCTGFDKYNIK